jgi:hypothetical protein
MPPIERRIATRLIGLRLDGVHGDAAPLIADHLLIVAHRRARRRVRSALAAESRRQKTGTEW